MAEDLVVADQAGSAQIARFASRKPVAWITIFDMLARFRLRRRLRRQRTTGGCMRKVVAAGRPSAVQVTAKT